VKRYTGSGKPYAGVPNEGPQRGPTPCEHHDIHVQVIEPNVVHAVNSRANAVLGGWTPPIEGLGLKGAQHQTSAEFGEGFKSGRSK
jgi:hypothetical protein